MRSTRVEQKTHSFSMYFWSAASGDDAVHERRAEHALVHDVLGESGIRLVRKMLEDARLEVVAVVLDELARNEDESRELGREAGPEETQHLRGEGVLSLNVLDPRLRRVGDHEAQRRKRRVLLDVRRDVHPGYGRDLLDLLDRLAADDAPEARVVLPAAVVEYLRRDRKLVADGLYDLDLAVEPGPVVHLLDHPVDEAPEEVALPELQYLRFHFLFSFC